MSESLSEECLTRFWAKTTHDRASQPYAYHPLICHMIDAAAVALVIWEEVLPPALRSNVSKAFGIHADLSGKFVALLTGLHDLGKASPPFTFRKEASALHQLYTDSPFACNPSFVPVAKEARHGYVTATELPEILRLSFGLRKEMARRIAIMIGGHHGVFPRSDDIKKIRQKRKIGGPEWAEARTILSRRLAEILSVGLPLITNDTATLDNATTMMLAGLVSVSDWIASNALFFPCEVADCREPHCIDIDQYFIRARQRAIHALDEIHWLGWPQPKTTRVFEALFPHLRGQPLRDLQSSCIEIAEKLNEPGIVLIEAPMGEGKTEAAMYVADRWSLSLEQRGCYFALPTQATSNQMFGRVRDFLQSRFDEGNILLQLLHGHAALNAEFQTLLDSKTNPDPLNVDQVYSDQEDDRCIPSVAAAEWFTHRKRGLLAPFGVGTIDQALLAVLQTRHVFVRLFGLAHKTIIIDEVHAYDAYMSVLLERLLEWLAALGSPVILLSATLPKQKRQALASAYLNGLQAQPKQRGTNDDHYPRITWATASNSDVIHIKTSTQNTRRIRLLHHESDLFSLGAKLQHALKHGGCAAVICNTVKRAQEMYGALKPLFPGNADDGVPELDLLHARYLFKDRSGREMRTLLRFGKPSGEVIGQNGQSHKVKRPHCVVLVSTQIIEQSLDLDFDLIVTDLAPVDLMLQRSGRMHRHKREHRPIGLEEPTIWILQPEIKENGAADFGAGKFVYDEHVLLRSWVAMRGREGIRIPHDVEELIEFVYDDQTPCPDPTLQDLWNDTKTKLDRKRAEKENRAKRNHILSPDCDDLLEDFNPQLEEDNPEFHRSMQALTRDDERLSVSVVFLRDDEMHRVDPRNVNDVRYLLERSVSISSWDVAESLISQSPPTSWRRRALLRHHRLLVLNKDDRTQIGDYSIHLHPELGIVIMSTKKETS
ncbi:CRISPR-associated helicase Cas3' [bacterium]|nr:CRISPR-associated helicase Cas3' [bacterium]